VLLVNLVQCLIVHEANIESVTDSDSDSMETEEDNMHLCGRIIGSLFALLEYDDEEWRYFDHYFQLFLDLAKSSDELAQYLLHEHTLSKFVEFFLEDEEQNASKLSKRIRLKKKAETTNFDNFVDYISYMSCHCGTDVEYNESSEERPHTQVEGAILTTDEEEKNCTTAEAFV